MSRVYNYDQWVAERRGSVRALALVAQAKPLRGRPRTPEEMRMLELSAIAAVERSYREGRLVRLGPREFELKVPGL